MEYPEQYQSRLGRTERRRKLMEQLLGQATSPLEQQQVSGRVVPLSPLQGLSKVAQAIMARKGITAADTEEEAIKKEFGAKRQDATDEVKNLMMGRPEQPYQLSPEEQFGSEQIPGLRNAAIEADPTKAAITAATSPYLQGSGISDVATAMMKARMKGSGSKSRPIPTSSGYWQETEEGWGPMLDDMGRPILPVPADARLVGEKKTASERARAGVEKEVEKPKREATIAATTEKTKNLDSLIDQALEQSEGYTTTGFVGQLTSNVGGTPAHNLKNTLDTIKANIGFDKLQEMRANSPTGGALGQVSERENELLQAVWSSVAQSQTEDQLKENLERVRNQVKESWKRINDAYEKDYGAPYTEGAEIGTATTGTPDTNVMRFDAQGNLIE